MYQNFQNHLQHTLQEIKDAGLYKNERVIITPQSSGIAVEGGQEVINFCANNYLGLADNKELIEAAKARMDARGYGMASVRFICGTQDTHKELERVISDFFGTEDTILYAACFDANGGLFEPLLTEEDAIISDALNHASIIDGVRLCKAVRYRYANGDMADLEEKLKAAQAQRFRIIATDGVFSMDGNVCPLDKIYELAQQYNALVMVHVGQGVRRFRRRFYDGQERDYRPAPSAQPSVSVLEFDSSYDSRCGHQDIRDSDTQQRVTGPSAR